MRRAILPRRRLFPRRDGVMPSRVPGWWIHWVTVTEAARILTSTTRAIVPIVTVDDRTIGSGRPGPVTQALLQRFREAAQSLTTHATSR